MKSKIGVRWIGFSCLFAACGAGAYEQALHWQGTNGSGTGEFHVASNWVQGVVPGPADLTAFNGYSAKDFRVTFTQDALHDTLSFVAPPAGYVTAFDLGGHAYEATNSMTIWQGAGGTVAISNGALRMPSVQLTPAPNGTTTNALLNISECATVWRTVTLGGIDATFAGGNLDVSSQLNVGSAQKGWATLRLGKGLQASFSNLVYVADSGGSTGTLVQAGADAVFHCPSVVAGRYGYGELDIVGGTTVVTGQFWAGSQPTGVGRVTVTGGSNTFGTVVGTHRIAVGGSGTGHFLMGGGTNVTCGVAVGNDAGGVGDLTVTGGLWLAREHIWVGHNGRGSLTVSGGELRQTLGGAVLAVGRYGSTTGEVTVAGGVVQADSVWLGGGGADSRGSLTLTGDGVLKAKSVMEKEAVAQSFLLCDGGTLQARASGALIQPLDDVRLTANGLVVDSAGYGVSVVPELRDAEGGAGGITKKGAGTLTLAGARTATGPVSVLGGALVVSNGVAVAAGVSRIDGALTLTGDSRLTVGAGAALAGTGTVARVTLADGAVFVRTKGDGAVSPLVAGDCAAEGGLAVALTGYTLPKLQTGLPLLRAPTAFIAPSNVNVTLNGQSAPALRANFAEVAGQQMLTVKYNAGTLISVQ